MSELASSTNAGGGDVLKKSIRHSEGAERPKNLVKNFRHSEALAEESP